MLQIVIIRPGCTDFDEQGRIKGNLDIPLNEHGAAQVEKLAAELVSLRIDALYTSTCQSAVQTAESLGQHLGLKAKPIAKLANVDHGLWHGKLIEEVKQKQPRVYRQLQEHPESVCPPDGEPLTDAQDRVRKELNKLLKRHHVGVIALVLPEPLATFARCLLQQSEVGDLWKVECECGSWSLVEARSEVAAAAP